ncbi:MAG: peptide chain release factor N(5)-glutamine methyltransferase [Bacteroidetes bacterium]|nr:peptide chain release factor N(5)-glutamine methyltransferase [Bacteroidota bacterium]
MKKAGPTVRDVRKSFQTGLRDLYSHDETDSIMYILFEDFLGWPKTKLHLDHSARLTESETAWFSNALSQLMESCPVQYVTGKAVFNELNFKVNPSVLIPRPETAELAEIIVRDLKTIDPHGFSALDVGTGSGCLAIYLKKHFPGITMHATDISEEALTVARNNAGLNEVEVSFHLSDILKDSKTLPDVVYNLVVSNPPYVTLKEKVAIRKNVKEYEPHSALFVPDADPLVFYKALMEFAQRGLSVNGLLYLEINESFGTELKEMLHSAGFSPAELLKDFRGKDRFFRAVFKTRS